MFIFAFLIIASLITGLYLPKLFKMNLFISERITFGSVISLSLFIQIIYLCTFLSGLKNLFIGVSIAIIALIAIFSFNKLYPELNSLKEEFLNSFKSIGKKENLALPIITIFWATIFVILFNKNLYVKPDGIYSSTSTDMPVHLSFITSFVWGDNFPHQTPLYAGEKLVYPFLSDYFSAFLISCGMNAIWSINFPGMLLCTLLTLIMYWFTYRLTKNKFAASLSPFLLFLGGGFGFWMFFENDLPSNGYKIWQTLNSAPSLYTDMDKYNFQFYNFIIGYLLPQRSFVFGFPLGIIALTLLWIALKGNNLKEIDSNHENVNEKKEYKKEHFLFAGLVTGLIPLFHFHSFMCVVIISCFLFALFLKKEKEYIKNWLYFFIPMTIVALPQMLFVLNRVSNSKSEVFKYYPGWLTKDNNYIWFWLKNTGFLFLMVFESLLNKETDKDLKKLYLPFVFLLVIANIISFSPCWIGDNAKIIYYWFIGSIPLVALFLSRIFKSYKVIATTILLTFILSGTLDITRFVFTPIRIFMIWDKFGSQIAEQIRQKTSPHSVFLTAPVHYSPLYLTGRATLMGEHVHVCTQGIDLYEREAEIKSVFESNDFNLRMSILKKLNPDYALIGPPERNMLKGSRFFDDNFKIVAQAGDQTVFKIK